MISSPTMTDTAACTEATATAEREGQIRLWRSFMQLGQMAREVLEDEVCASIGVPDDGLAILRLLRWSGPQPAAYISAFLAGATGDNGASHQRPGLHETLDAMARRGILRQADPADGASEPRFELTPEGSDATQRIVDRQRALLWAATGKVDPKHRPFLSELFEQLIVGLTEQSETFDIVCAECWAFDHSDCYQTVPRHQCAFRRTERARTDPTPECRDGP